eukprot:13980935-Ditylum_brightwellii.AAC.1
MSHLLAMIFLKHYCKYHEGSTPEDTCLHCTDNKGVVQRMDWYHQRTIKTATECLVPDYDIQAQVGEIYDTMELGIPTEWIR